MADKRATPSPAAQSSTSLQRGKACLRCRKRKMRCDGIKPACQQCVRAKKSDACEYDDGKGKTRTQIMREHIARLEARVKELESPEVTTPPITLFDPHAASPYFSESSSSSSHDSPGTLSLSASASPTPFPVADMETPHWDGHWGSMNDFPAVPNMSDAYSPEDPPMELAHMLLEIFLPHRHQCGLEIHVGRIRETLAMPLSEQRHPVLMNAIYLWACYLSRPGSLCEHEPLYLSRALAAVNDAIANPAKVVDFIQASCLLSVYFLSNGRLLEGSYHASAAASLALQWGLHQIGSGRDEYASASSPGAVERESTFRLEPAKDAIEQGERILAFWQVFNLDRCWSVALQRPATIPDSKHPWTAITTPWPQRMEDYETGEVDIGTGSPTIHAFFIHQAQVSNAVGGFSTFALQAKAAALFEGASRLSSSWSPQLSTSPSLTDNFRAFEHTITRFTTTLLPLHQLGATLPDDKYTLILIHSLAHASMIRLHEPFLDDGVSREVALRAARAVTVVAKHVGEADFGYLDPLIGHTWVCAARVLISELAQLQTTWPPANTADIRGELGTLLYSMTKLAVRFPLLGYQATKVQKLLDAN
ncbi:hypothetical protein EIP91_008531 [Steccherinum ochraceum]|uniref:Zn(2)-C6 fungal-type domain-containing protein n=1 Tax=Steccherinum ochraceum TaxID=92696 RepID=A0A4V6N713_9APHY|nr:hypothetical protein EIP91_008531 [Steccherinum ochraceum]